MSLPVSLAAWRQAEAEAVAALAIERARSVVRARARRTMRVGGQPIRAKHLAEYLAVVGGGASRQAVQRVTGCCRIGLARRLARIEDLRDDPRLDVLLDSLAEVMRT